MESRAGEGAGGTAARTREEPLDFTVRETDPLFVLRVRNPLHGTQYEVFLPEFPARESALCTCPDFARRARGTCKHLEGAFRFLEEHPVEAPRPRPAGRPAAAIWATVDIRRATRKAGPVTLSGLRAEGAALYDVAADDPARSEGPPRPGE